MKKIIIWIFIGFLLIGTSLVSGIPKTQNDYVAYWNFDEGSGSIAHDSSVNGLDGTIYGVAWTSDSVLGNALNFDGTDSDYIELNNPDSLKFSDESFTLSAWVQIKDNVNNWRCFISLGPRYVNYPAITLTKCRSGNMEMEGRIIFQVCQTPYAVSRCMSLEDGNTLPKNQWMHVVGVCDYGNSETRLYIDGVLQDSQQLYNYDMKTASNFRVLFGDFANQDTASAWQNNHKGLLDEVKIFTSALTDNEVIELFKEPFGNTILIGQISNLNSDVHTMSFNAINLRVISFSPFEINKYSANEQVFVLKDKIGLLSSGFAFGLFKTLI
jgi:hypothetical protein